MKDRYDDYVQTVKSPKKQETRTADEIKEDIGRGLDAIGAL